jgi:hypothetical protein
LPRTRSEALALSSIFKYFWIPDQVRDDTVESFFTISSNLDS